MGEGGFRWTGDVRGHHVVLDADETGWSTLLRLQVDGTERALSCSSLHRVRYDLGGGRRVLVRLSDGGHVSGVIYRAGRHRARLRPPPGCWVANRLPARVSHAEECRRRGPHTLRAVVGARRRTRFARPRLPRQWRAFGVAGMSFLVGFLPTLGGWSGGAAW